MKQLRRLLPYIPYFLAAVMVLGPLLLPGFVLSMDMVFTPQMPMPDHVDNTFIFYTLLHILSFVLPADLVEKCLLIAILFFAGVGIHRLLQSESAQRTWLIYAAGIFYMVNPFVYDRFMAGQYGVLLGYTLLPWFTACLLTFVRGPNLKNATYLCAWITGMSIVSIHSLGFVAVLSVTAICVYVQGKEHLFDIAKYGVLVLALFGIVSSYWLLPTISGHGRIADSLTTFTNSERAAFATVDANGLGRFGSVLGLQGFWQENRNLFLTLADVNGAWGVVQLLIWLLVAFGIAISWRSQRRQNIFFFISGAIAAILASGIGDNWLAVHVPFFVGFREPQKFVAVIAFTYAYFLFWGVSWLAVKLSKNQWMVIGAITLLLSAYTPMMLWGFRGQLQPAIYPKDWYSLNKQLGRANGGKVLFLPWHLYMSYSFAHNRIIASPAPAFFSAPIVASDDPELDGVTSQTFDPVRERIQRQILPAAAKGGDIAMPLHTLGINYIIVAKEYDYHQYDYLSDRIGITLVSDSSSIRLYQVKAHQ